ncbi:hypothetical protein [Pseudomonas triticicola]|uniref:hypothetical protein n=1 Tax=Pseudomonas triticicola TaxID=2842345 RepID=UPI003EBF32CA
MNKINFILGLCLLGASLPGQASDRLYSASISSNGTIEAQTPKWIDTISHSIDENYAATYNINFARGVFTKQPEFCFVSINDQSSFDAALFGVAKLGGKPDKNQVTVISRLVGTDRAPSVYAMSYYLICKG